VVVWCSGAEENVNGGGDTPENQHKYRGNIRVPFRVRVCVSAACLSKLHERAHRAAAVTWQRWAGAMLRCDEWRLWSAQATGRKVSKYVTDRHRATSHMHISVLAAGTPILHKYVDGNLMPTPALRFDTDLSLARARTRSRLRAEQPLTNNSEPYSDPAAAAHKHHQVGTHSPLHMRAEVVRWQAVGSCPLARACTRGGCCSGYTPPQVHFPPLPPPSLLLPVLINAPFLLLQ